MTPFPCSPGRLLAIGCIAVMSTLPAAAIDSHPVRAYLVAEVDAIAANGVFGVGVGLEMEEGWHTYWRYSGDAGLPTRVDWALPTGFEAGNLQWPAPHKYTEQGELVTYGYEHETMLLTEMRAPSALPAGSSADLVASVSWLVCRDLCIPGDTTLTLTLPFGPADDQQADAAHQGQFARYRAQLPRIYSETDPVAVTHRLLSADLLSADDESISGDGGSMIVELELAARDEAGGRGIVDLSPDFYPIGGDGFDLFPPKLKPVQAADRVVLQLEITPYGDLPTQLGGVLAFLEATGEWTFRSIELDLASPGRRSGLAGSAGVAGGAAEPRSLLVYLILAALGGLILNVMPCVLPVISLKVLGFVSHAREERARVRQLGVAFSLGMVAAFAVLAVVVVLLKAGGEQIGWGFQFQSPGFVLALTSLIFVLAMSLFGLLSITLPGTRTNLGGLAESEGLTGSFFNGVLATILATPCTAPFLGSALGFAFTQPGGVIFAVFVATGVGMALPYLLLAAEPRWMRFLPKPGAWMERFKQLMGFLLMATVLWLLWVLGKQLGMEAVVWTGAFLLCLALACWIPGKWTDLRSTRGQRAWAWGLAIIVSVGGYGLFLHPLLEQEARLAAGEGTAGADDWLPFTAARVDSLVADGNHVFIDFTAEWCWTCKVNKRTVLDDEAIERQFEELGVRRVRADWTSRNPQITVMLRSFGRSGVPLYVIYPANRPDLPLVLPELITTGIVLERLQEAARLSRPNPVASSLAKTGFSEP